VADPMIGELLRAARRILNRHLAGVHRLLRELETDRPSRAQPRSVANASPRRRPGRAR
jgi:hypothetical protein